MLTALGTLFTLFLIAFVLGDVRVSSSHDFGSHEGRAVNARAEVAAPSHFESLPALRKRQATRKSGGQDQPAPEQGSRYDRPWHDAVVPKRNVPSSQDFPPPPPPRRDPYANPSGGGGQSLIVQQGSSSQHQRAQQAPAPGQEGPSPGYESMHQYARTGSGRGGPQRQRFYQQPIRSAEEAPAYEGGAAEGESDKAKKRRQRIRELSNSLYDARPENFHDMTRGYSREKFAAAAVHASEKQRSWDLMPRNTIVGDTHELRRNMNRRANQAMGWWIDSGRTNVDAKEQAAIRWVLKNAHYSKPWGALVNAHELQYFHDKIDIRTRRSAGFRTIGHRPLVRSVQREPLETVHKAGEHSVTKTESKEKESGGPPTHHVHGAGEHLFEQAGREEHHLTETMSEHLQNPIGRSSMKAASEEKYQGERTPKHESLGAMNLGGKERGRVEGSPKRGSSMKAIGETKHRDEGTSKHGLHEATEHSPMKFSEQTEPPHTKGGEAKHLEQNPGGHLLKVLARPSEETRLQAGWAQQQQHLNSEQHQHQQLEYQHHYQPQQQQLEYQHHYQHQHQHLEPQHYYQQQLEQHHHYQQQQQQQQLEHEHHHYRQQQEHQHQRQQPEQSERLESLDRTSLQHQEGSSQAHATAELQYKTQKLTLKTQKLNYKQEKLKQAEDMRRRREDTLLRHEEHTQKVQGLIGLQATHLFAAQQLQFQMQHHQKASEDLQQEAEHYHPDRIKSFMASTPSSSAPSTPGR